MTTTDFTALQAVALAVADAAHAPALARFRRADLVVTDKGAGAAADPRFDPVTEADREAESAMRAVIAARRPDDSIFGEEHAAVLGDSGLSWMLDPIDGTRAFIAGAPTWGVLVALSDADGPLIGVVDQPFTGERCLGLRPPAGPREAFWRRGGETRALRTRRCAGLPDATLLSTYPEIGDAAEHAAFRRVADRVRLTRYGLDCYGYMLVALGCADLVVEAGLQPYDVQALIPVIEGAGGVITDWRGGPCRQGGRVIAAGDARVHAAALDLLAAG